MKDFLSEEELIAYAKPYLKARGFKKKNKRWTKDIGEFTLCFYIQGSYYDKDRYYIRPGIFINALLPTDLFYGHFFIQIEPTTPEEIMQIFEQWCDEWTNKALIKERLIALIERNPFEKQLEDYTKVPILAKGFYGLDSWPGSITKQYILDTF